MRHIDHQVRASFIGNFPEFLKVNLPRIGAGAGHNQLRLHLQSDPAQFLIINLFGFFIHAVAVELVQPTGEIQLMPMRQMAAGA